MARIWSEEQLIADGFERVYAGLAWYDGPRAGLADIDGEPHYFQGSDYDSTAEDDTYSVWPASRTATELEREQWAIFAHWDQHRQAGIVGLESHPGHGGVDARYDESTTLLEPYRRPPADARRLVGELRFVNGPRYRVDGVDYWFRWRAAT